MPNPSVSLLFFPVAAGAGPSVAQVVAHTWPTYLPAGLTPEQAAVTTPAATLAEFEYQIAQLHERLEALRDEARRRFEHEESSHLRDSAAEAV